MEAMICTCATLRLMLLPNDTFFRVSIDSQLNEMTHAIFNELLSQVFLANPTYNLTSDT